MKTPNERTHAAGLLSAIIDVTLKNRAENLLLWYLNNARRCKFLYNSITVITIICGAVIPVINLMSTPSRKDFIVSGIAALGTVLSGVISVFNLKGNWYRYREYTELMKDECFRYIYGIGDYEGKDADLQFADKLSSIALEENKSWLRTKNTKTVINSEVG